MLQKVDNIYIPTSFISFHQSTTSHPTLDRMIKWFIGKRTCSLSIRYSLLLCSYCVCLFRFNLSLLFLLFLLSLYIYIYIYIYCSCSCCWKHYLYSVVIVLIIVGVGVVIVVSLLVNVYPLPPQTRTHRTHRTHRSTSDTDTPTVIHSYSHTIHTSPVNRHTHNNIQYCTHK